MPGSVDYEFLRKLCYIFISVLVKKHSDLSGLSLMPQLDSLSHGNRFRLRVVTQNGSTCSPCELNKNISLHFEEGVVPFLKR